jgi:hypothetical protein
MIDYIGISKDMIDDLEQIKCLLAEKHEQGLEVFRLELFSTRLYWDISWYHSQNSSWPASFSPFSLILCATRSAYCHPTTTILRNTRPALPSPPTLTIFFHFHHQPKLKGNFSPKIKSKSRSKSHPSGILTQIRHGTRIFS